MTQHQVVNLRHGYAIVFGDAEAQRDYEASCERARAGQLSRYAVAPLQAITLHDGRRLGPGDPVRLRDFSSDETPAWAQVERLVRKGIVLESDSVRDEDEGPEAA